MTKEYKLQPFYITKDWEIKRNEFYNIDPADNAPEDDKFNNIYCQEDMLWLTCGNYNLDLGWYGSDNLDSETTGFMLVLFRGKDWNNCELLELLRTKLKSEVVEKIELLVKAVSSGFFDKKKGYEISENQITYKYIGEHLRFSIIDNFDELLK